MNIKKTFIKKLWNACNINARDLCFINDFCFLLLNKVVVTYYKNNFQLATDATNLDKTARLMCLETQISISSIATTFLKDLKITEKDKKQLFTRIRLNIFHSLRRLQKINFSQEPILQVIKNKTGNRHLSNSIQISREVIDLFLKEKNFTRIDDLLYFRLEEFCTDSKTLSAKDLLLFKLLCTDFKLQLFKTSINVPKTEIDSIITQLTSELSKAEAKKKKRALLDAWYRLIKKGIILLNNPYQITLSWYQFNYKISTILSSFYKQTKEYCNYVKKIKQSGNNLGLNLNLRL